MRLLNVFLSVVVAGAFCSAALSATRFPGKEIASDVDTGLVSGPDARKNDVVKPKMLYMTIELQGGGARLSTATGTVTCVKGKLIEEKTYDTKRAGLVKMPVVPPGASLCSVSAQAIGSGKIRVAIRVVR